MQRYGQMKKTYKTVGILLFVVFILTLHAAAEEGRYASRISKEDCFLCSDHGGTAYAEYWGQDNVGVVHLNTFEILPIRINQYDDAGEIVRKESGTMESLGLYHNDTYVNSMTNPDRGYSNVKISGVKYKTDRKSIQMHLCDTCIEALNQLNWNNDTPPEFAILNFKERAIRPLEQTLTWFFSGNFGINCEYKDNGDIDILIAYLPPRWDETQ